MSEEVIIPVSEAKPTADMATTSTDTKPHDDFKLNFERISKQEKHNSEIRKQLDEKRKAFEVDKADLEKYRQFDKELKADPLSVLEKLGLPLDRIQQLAQQRNVPQNPEARQAIELAKRLEKQLSDRDEKEKQEKLSREEVKLNASIAETIKADNFDILEHLEMQNTVREYMEAYYDETGEIVSIKDACQAVADELSEKLMKVKDSRFLKPKEVVSEPVPEVLKSAEPKTLSNKMTQTSEKVGRSVSDTDRMKEALRILSLAK